MFAWPLWGAIVGGLTRAGQLVTRIFPQLGRFFGFGGAGLLAGTILGFNKADLAAGALGGIVAYFVLREMK